MPTARDNAPVTRSDLADALAVAADQLNRSARGSNTDMAIAGALGDVANALLEMAETFATPAK